MVYKDFKKEMRKDGTFKGIKNSVFLKRDELILSHLRNITTKRIAEKLDNI